MACIFRLYLCILSRYIFCRNLLKVLLPSSLFFCRVGVPVPVVTILCLRVDSATTGQPQTVLPKHREISQLSQYRDTGRFVAGTTYRWISSPANIKAIKINNNINNINLNTIKIGNINLNTNKIGNINLSTIIIPR